MLLCCTARVDLFCLRNGPTWAALLGSTFPLLAQEVLELVHQLLRVEVFVTQGARCRIPHRSIIAQLLRYPSVKQGMQLPLTFPQSMLGPRIEHQLLGLIGPLVNLSGTAWGESSVR